MKHSHVMFHENPFIPHLALMYRYVDTRKGTGTHDEVLENMLFQPPFSFYASLPRMLVLTEKVGGPSGEL
jgi:hypothetical protein